MNLSRGRTISHARGYMRYQRTTKNNQPNGLSNAIFRPIRTFFSSISRHVVLSDLTSNCCLMLRNFVQNKLAIYIQSER